jgi:hypothetical protein
MTCCQTECVALRGIASAVPDHVVSAETASGIQDSEIAKIVAEALRRGLAVLPPVICLSEGLAGEPLRGVA